LRQGTFIGETNEDEIKKENANQSERSSETRETVMANSNTRFSNGSQEEIQSRRNAVNTSSEDLADSSSEQSDSQNYGQEQREVSEPKQIKLGGRSSGLLWPSNWEFEPDVGRVADGIPGRAHRLKALGNAIVPQIAEEIGKAIMEVYHG